MRWMHISICIFVNALNHVVPLLRQGKTTEAGISVVVDYAHLKIAFNRSD